MALYITVARLQDGKLGVAFRFRKGARALPFLRNVHACFEAHLISY
jgi:hypothetical protein